MVINNLDIKCRMIKPAKTYPPLTIDSNAPLSLSITLKRFKPIARWNAQFINSFCSVQKLKLAPRHTLKRPKARDNAVMEERFGITTAKRVDHLKKGILNNRIVQCTNVYPNSAVAFLRQFRP